MDTWLTLAETEKMRMAQEKTREASNALRFALEQMEAAIETGRDLLHAMDDYYDRVEGELARVEALQKGE